MPTSNYPAFDVAIDNDDGTTSPVPAQTINVYNVTGAAALSDLASDANGHVAGGTLSVAAGTLIRFSGKRADGVCGYAEVLTA